MKRARANLARTSNCHLLVEHIPTARSIANGVREVVVLQIYSNRIKPQDERERERERATKKEPSTLD